MTQINQQLLHTRPHSLQQALQLLDQTAYTILAGGTDYYPSLRDSTPDSAVMDITGIEELKRLQVDEHGLTIGALCSWTDIIRADLPASLKALQLAAKEVGSVQIQSRASIAGNLCNASPAADGLPPLLICNAVVNLASASNTRRVALSDFVLGNRRTALKPGELVTSISIPASGLGGVSDFIKLGAREYLVISIVMVASRLLVEDGIIIEAAVSAGSCSEVAVRLQEVESLLIGKPATEQTILNQLPASLGALSPINDVRGTAAYRKDACLSLVRRSLNRCLLAAGETAA